MLAFSLWARLLLTEGTSVRVRGDIASLALRNVIARMMYGKDLSVCEQCRGESRGSGP